MTMTFLDAVKILMTSVDMHIGQVLENNPSDEEFEAYFSEQGWGTAQVNACRIVKKHFKRKGLEAAWGF